MFERINEFSRPQFTIPVLIKCDVYDRQEKTVSCNVIEYLDNTTWFAKDLPVLEDNLSIAMSFYDVANILAYSVDTDKYKILTNNSNFHSQPHTLIVNSTQVYVTNRCISLLL